MFRTLLQLPLFQGLSQEDFTNILGKVKFHFTKYNSGEIMLKNKGVCDKLTFLLKGEITVSTASEGESLVFLEHQESPYLIEPYSLFGMDTLYRSTYIARSDINVLSIDKSYVVRELLKYDIFKLNYTNNICNKVQILQSRLLMPMPTQIKSKIVHFVYIHAEKMEGGKILRIKMENLARNLGDTRLNVSKALNEFQEQNLVQLRRKEIVIPDACALYEWVTPYMVAE